MIAAWWCRQSLPVPLTCYSPLSFARLGIHGGACMRTCCLLASRMGRAKKRGSTGVAR